MAKDIAVFVDDKGNTASMDARGKIIVYGKRQGSWQVEREKELFLDKSGGMKGLRQGMAEALDFLGSCKIFAALAVVGIPYFELEKAGCIIWEVEGRAEALLGYILGKEEGCQPEMPEETGKIPAPVEVSPGTFEISLLDIQRSNSGVTSKQVLLPFLRKVRFCSLNIYCDHVPPWLEAQILEGSLTADVTKLIGNELKISVSKKCCR